LANLKNYLKKKFTKKELALVRNAFDIVGDIAILEIPRELNKKQKIIAKAVLDLHNNVKAVYKEVGGRKGKLRLQKLQWLAGEKRTETICRENGVSLKLDVAKVYFSPRIASERKRIYQQVKKGEKVLVMFSGAAPYVIEIAKYANATVYGIEVNKAAHKYAVENLKLNKIDAKLFCGDVRKVLPKLKKFDRIAMPLPKGAGSYLELAFKHVKRNGIIHFYDFLPEEEIPSAAIKKITASAKKAKKKIKVKKTVKCGQLAPRAYRVCVDFKVV
tara:strand:+ start:4873 stop:5691 length:819 start_codon:yes stop_codon:yes gene_type:complete